MGSVLKSEGELDVEISEAHPFAVLYWMVSLYRGRNSTGSKNPAVVSWSPSFCGLPTITVGGIATAADCIRRMIESERGAAVIAIGRNLACRTSLFGVFMYRPYPPPSTIYTQLLAF